MAKTTFRKDYRNYYDEVIEYTFNVYRKFALYYTILFLLFSLGVGLTDTENTILTCGMAAIISAVSFIVYLVSKGRILKRKKAITVFYNLYLFFFLMAITLLYFVHPSHMAYTILLCSIITSAMTTIHPMHYDFILLSVFIIDNIIHFTMQEVGDWVTISGYLINDILVLVFGIGVNVIFADMKFREYKQKHFLQNESYHDPLTNIFNRRYVERYVELNFDGTDEWAMFLIDIDNFKLANDSLGHEYGDELLCRISDILRNNFRKTDCVARIGGDEFIVLMPKVTEKSIVIEKAKNILDNFPIEIEDSKGYQSITVSVSIGIAFTKMGTEITYEEMYRKADHYMYKAKEKGKGVAVMEGTNGRREQLIM